MKLYLGFYKFEYEGDEKLTHRTLLKIFVNPILRFIQFWTDRPYVITSNIDFGYFVEPDTRKLKIIKPRFISYGFSRVKYYKHFITPEILKRAEKL